MKTTFQTRYDYFENLLMSFGLKNILATLMEFMNLVFRKYVDSFVIIFVDERVSDHVRHLRIVLQGLKDNQLFAMFSKYEFLLRSVAFHGHVVSSEMVEFDPR